MFERLNWLLLEKAELIFNKNILIVGVGGVGSYALETLVRSGVKNITIIDKDNIDITNLNRQLMTNINNVGESKVFAFKKRIESINPDCNLTIVNEFLTKANINTIFRANYDYVIDACDTLDTKVCIIDYCIKNKIKFICSLGMACRVNSSLIKVTDLSKTFNDPLARKLRTLVKDNNIKGKIPVVFSEEEPIKNGKLGSIAHVPATAGLLITNYIVNDIIGEL